MELIYWRHPTLPGIKVEEVSGGESLPEKVWLDMARQVYCENGVDAYREIGHFHSGAPFLYGYAGRISISHTEGLFAVATLPATPEVELGVFSERAALGIDVERADREQVVKILDRFMAEEEKPLVDSSDVELCVRAWTSKEAVYKAMLSPGLDFRRDIRIIRMPRPAPVVPVFDPKEFNLPDQSDSWRSLLGEAQVSLPDGTNQSFLLFSYRSDDFVVTLAYAARCAKFGKSGL
ncbi:MAG: 4'-phosphopantetheinyl transferase superfamily protein [Muribaculaceae bacterium]|nr:4'-phosphopantetheinyl transferase superfamily protein [Muribaculaceae bacterium]